jgi:Replication-relaxation
MNGHIRETRDIREAGYGIQNGIETAAPESLPAPAESEQRRTWDVPPGGIITNGAGRLRRRRPDTYHHAWSAVPVGPVSARKLSKGLNERDYLILLMAERSHVVTTEQIARAFFDSPVTARKRIRLLRERRFLATPEVDHRAVSAAVGHRGGAHNAPLVLDWNGKYLLEHLSYNLRTWDPATVAQANSRFGHTLGVSEVWSYIVAAARATHERVSQSGASGYPEAKEAKEARDRLAVGLLNERESVVYHEGCTGWSLEMERGEGSGAETGVRAEEWKNWKPRPLVVPDATLVLAVTPDERGQAYYEAARKNNSKSPSSYQGSWHQGLLPAVPSPAGMRAAEHQGSTRYRCVFLEMETGSNSSKDMMHKIERYNHLYDRLIHGDMMHGENWKTLFGPTLPIIVVAVRDKSQVGGQVTSWRAHYSAGPSGSVILVNLEVLALAYAGGTYANATGRSRLLTQPCWLDVMRSEGPKWRPLRDILGLRI